MDFVKSLVYPTLFPDQYYDCQESKNPFIRADFRQGLIFSAQFVYLSKPVSLLCAGRIIDDSYNRFRIEPVSLFEVRYVIC